MTGWPEEETDEPDLILTWQRTVVRKRSGKCACEQLAGCNCLVRIKYLYWQYYTYCRHYCNLCLESWQFHRFSYSVNPTSTTSYIVTGTDINGCINCDTVTVTVNPLPSVFLQVRDQSILYWFYDFIYSNRSKYLSMESDWNNFGASVLITPSANLHILSLERMQWLCEQWYRFCNCKSNPVVNLYPHFLCPGFSTTTLDAGKWFNIHG